VGFNAYADTGLTTDNVVYGAGAAAADADDFLVYDSATGTLFYDADGSGSGAAQAVVTVAGLSQADLYAMLGAADPATQDTLL
jgi:Ca2+-binding RTX toxin-like protein